MVEVYKKMKKKPINIMNTVGPVIIFCVLLALSIGVPFWIGAKIIDPSDIVESVLSWFAGAMAIVFGIGGLFVLGFLLYGVYQMYNPLSRKIYDLICETIKKISLPKKKEKKDSVSNLKGE